MQYEAADPLSRSERDGDAGAERFAEHHDALRGHPRGSKRIGCLGIRDHSRFRRAAGRAAVAAIAQRHEPIAATGQRAEAIRTRAQRTGVAVEIQHQRQIALRRRVPNDHLFAVCGIENELLHVEQPGRGRWRA